jgi:hypothetical protein
MIGGDKNEMKDFFVPNFCRLMALLSVRIFWETLFCLSNFRT